MDTKLAAMKMKSFQDSFAFQFETFFDTTFDDQILDSVSLSDVGKGRMKVAIKKVAKEAFLAGKIAGLEKAEQIIRSPVFKGMPETQAVAVHNLSFQE